MYTKNNTAHAFNLSEEQWIGTRKMLSRCKLEKKVGLQSEDEIGQLITREKEAKSDKEKLFSAIIVIVVIITLKCRASKVR